MSEEFYKIDKLMPFKTKPQEHAYIHDGDLQINYPPNLRETNSTSFSNIYAHYLEGAGKTPQESALDIVDERQDVQVAMNEWEDTFKQMMEISTRLESACREVRDMLSSG